MDGLDTTFALLSKTDNDAAVPVLIAALDSPRQDIGQRALVALLSRRNPAGGQEILRRLPTMRSEWKAILRQHHGRMTRSLRDALLSSETAVCQSACQAVVWFREYDLVPTLLGVMEDRGRATADLAARTLLELLGHLYEELGGARDAVDRRDPQNVRRHVLNSLELSLARFVQHKRREAIEAFLMLASRDNAVLKQILQNPHHSAFLALLDVMGKSSRGGVIRLLLAFLEDPHVPPAALGVVANRSDIKFVQYMLRKIGREPSATVAANLKRVESIPWLIDAGRLLSQFDETSQHATVRLVMTAGIPRVQAFATIEYLLLHGKPRGRCEAARALADFSGSDANALAMRALDDPDPQVQANIIAQLRHRGIPGVLPNLLELVDSPYEVVRRAARESLSEFSFKRFLAAFDMLDEQVRRSTGLLVKKIDPQTIPGLREEMASPMRTRRLRALAIARTIEAVDALAEEIIERIGDEDHMVRMEAAMALGRSPLPIARQALEAARADTSEVVREAAERSLAESAALVEWRQSMADPRD